MKHASPWKPQNRVLDSLPADVCARLRPHLQLIEMPVGKILYVSDSHQNHLYFPRSGVVSLLYVMQDGATGEIAMTGNEGIVGVAVLVDSTSTPTRAEVQIAGEAWMLKTEAVERELHRGGAFQILVLRYTQLLLSQMAQAVICNRHHSVEKQVCRWLLLALDRAGSEELRITQEAISHLLAVRREGVTEVAGRLQEAGLISYSRGRIRLLDRDGLEQRSCDCYRVLSREYERLMATAPGI